MGAYSLSVPSLGKVPAGFQSVFWIVGHAAFEDGHTFKGHVLMRGQLITTYAAIADAMAYCFNRAIVKPSVKEVRVILLWLQSEGMITVKPLIDGTSANKGRPTDLTRAYVGLLISIVNYDTYQDYKSYKGRDKGRPSLEQGQLRERIEKEYIKTVSFRQACVKNFNYGGKTGYQPNKEDNQWNRSLQEQGH